MKGRILSTVALWAILVTVIVVFRAQGAIWLTAIAAALTQFEFYKMMGRLGHRPLWGTGVVFGLLITLSPFYFPAGIIQGPQLLAPAIFAIVVIALLRKPRGNAIQALSTSLLGLLLVPFTLLHISLMVDAFAQQPPQGLLMGLWLVAATKFTDVGALLVGMKFGRHKMAPILSPKKTWEGAVGGVVISTLVSYVLVLALRDYFPAGFHPWIAAAISPAVAIATIYSDLLESAFKRECGVKDSGKIIPGIGGIFDLTDSSMLSAPTAYYLVMMVLN